MYNYKILCLSVLNDDNTVVHQICKYKNFHSWSIFCAYSCSHYNKENDNNKRFERSPVLDDVGSPVPLEIALKEINLRELDKCLIQWSTGSCFV